LNPDELAGLLAIIERASFRESAECAGASRWSQGWRREGNLKRGPGRVLIGTVPDGCARSTTRKTGKARSSARITGKRESTCTRSSVPDSIIKLIYINTRRLSMNQVVGWRGAEHFEVRARRVRGTSTQELARALVD
jgi:hypothetical protein